MAEKCLQITNHDFLIYRDSNNDVKVSVMLINNDIWLTQNLKKRYSNIQLIVAGNGPICVTSFFSFLYYYIIKKSRFLN